MHQLSDTTGHRNASERALVPDVYRIVRLRKNTHDTFTIDLVNNDTGGGMHFAPGQFNMLQVFGVGEVPISISGDSADTTTLTHTIRNVGSVTQVMQNMSAGDLIGVRGPFGNGWPVKAAEGDDLVLMAGGIGLAPLRPVIYHALANRERYGKFVILYGTRSPHDILYQRELEQWRGRFDVEAFVTVDQADRSWKAQVGVVTTLIPSAAFDPLQTTVMACGPEVMMRFSAMSMIKVGVPPENIFLSLERNMKCGIGLCGHCQYAGRFICKDGPVFDYQSVKGLLTVREL